MVNPGSSWGQAGVKLGSSRGQAGVKLGSGCMALPRAWSAASRACPSAPPWRARPPPAPPRRRVVENKHPTAFGSTLTLGVNAHTYARGKRRRVDVDGVLVPKNHPLIRTHGGAEGESTWVVCLFSIITLPWCRPARSAAARAWSCFPARPMRRRCTGWTARCAARWPRPRRRRRRRRPPRRRVIQNNHSTDIGA